MPNADGPDMKALQEFMAAVSKSGLPKDIQDKLRCMLDDGITLKQDIYDTIFSNIPGDVREQYRTSEAVQRNVDQIAFNVFTTLELLYASCNRDNRVAASVAFLAMLVAKQRADRDSSAEEAAGAKPAGG